MEKTDKRKTEYELLYAVLCFFLFSLCGWQFFRGRKVDYFPVFTKAFTYVDNWLEDEGQYRSVTDCLHEVFHSAESDSN